MSARTAIVAGATGLVGGQCLDLLLRSPAYGRVVALVRKPLSLQNPKLECRVVDFDRFEATAGDLAADDVFCCLGTTMKKAGSQEAFRRVDFDYPMAIARLVAKRPGSRYFLVSSVGASARSGNFYLRTKGELEEALAQLPFAAVHAFRPSFLLGERGESRPAERIGIAVFRALNPLISGPFRKYRAITAHDVAVAMLSAANGPAAGGLVVHEGAALNT